MTGVEYTLLFGAFILVGAALGGLIGYAVGFSIAWDHAYRCGIAQGRRDVLFECQVTRVRAAAGPQCESAEQPNTGVS